jgi:predicted CoA-binding protein
MAKEKVKHKEEPIMSQTVAILGASENPERPSHRAFESLKHHGYHPIPINPFIGILDETPVTGILKEVDAHIDTLTVYVNPRVSSELAPDILKLKPKRVIFNPGSENRELEAELERAGIHVVEGCTETLLSNGEFDKA